MPFIVKTNAGKVAIQQFSSTVEKKNEAIYSCKIAKIAGEANGVHVYVRFHYDQEWKKYHWKKFQKLERECHNFMIKMDIMLDTFVGKISTYHRHRWQNGNIN